MRKAFSFLSLSAPTHTPHLRGSIQRLRLLSPVQTDATLLANNSQHFWMLHVASACTPSALLGVFAFVCTPLPRRTQQLPTLFAQQCWELLRPFAGSPESLTGIKETLTLSSPCATFSQALSLNSFAWTTWPETLQPHEIMMSRDKGNVDQGAN